MRICVALGFRLAVRSPYSYGLQLSQRESPSNFSVTLLVNVWKTTFREQPVHPTFFAISLKFERNAEQLQAGFPTWCRARFVRRDSLRSES
jgi:hypothetical protein